MKSIVLILGFLGPTVTTAIFVLLKICAIILWPWLWVFSPVWITWIFEWLAGIILMGYFLVKLLLYKE